MVMDAAAAAARPDVDATIITKDRLGVGGTDADAIVAGAVLQLLAIGDNRGVSARALAELTSALASRSEDGGALAAALAEWSARGAVPGAAAPPADIAAVDAAAVAAMAALRANLLSYTVAPC